MAMGARSRRSRSNGSAGVRKRPPRNRLGKPKETVVCAMQKGRVPTKVRQREQLIVAMLQQPSLEKAAASIGISKATAWRVTNTPEFQQEFRRARRVAFSQATARLQ